MRSDDVILREVLSFVPEGGARGRGRPRRRLYDTIKGDLAARGIETATRDQNNFWLSLANMAVDRNAWRVNIVNANI